MKKKSAKKSPAKKAAPPTNDNVVTLKALAAELKIAPRAARMRLRAAEGLDHGKGGRWEWEKGSAELTKVRKVLSDE